MGDAGYIFYSSDGKNEHFVSVDDHNKITSSIKIVSCLYHLEEIFLMVINSLTEFNQSVFRFSNEWRLRNCHDDYYITMMRIELNQKALSFLSAMDLYITYVFKQDKKVSRFNVNETLIDVESIQNAKTLRNYIQHFHAFPLTLSSSESKCSNDVSLYSFRVKVELDSICEEVMENLHGKTKVGLSRMRRIGERLDVYEIFNGAYRSLLKAHESVRQSEFYAGKGSEAICFLSNLEGVRRAKELLYMCDASNPNPDMCIGMFPYLYTRQIEFIRYMERTYSCNSELSSMYFTNAPSGFVDTVSKKYWNDYFHQNRPKAVPDSAAE